MSRFLKKPFPAKMQAIKYHFKVKIWNHVFPYIPLPVKLPWGSWWLAYDDVFGDGVFAGIMRGDLEEFLARFVKWGMTVIDVGAHQGFFTLLMSKLVGPKGLVVAFEPSPRELKRLKLNVTINRCRNVRVEGYAIGDRKGVVEFFVVSDRWTTRNSLVAPKIHRTEHVFVNMTTLDDYLQETQIVSVDLVKIDVEGAELMVLQGAERLLTSPWQPIIICELNDEVISWGDWHHSTLDVVEFLRAREFSWFEISHGGGLKPLEMAPFYRGDFVAVPKERLGEIASLMKERER
jgi:FkbM family methyltransferase